MTTVLFNVNEYVSVRLTRDGVNRFYQWYEEAGIVLEEGLEIDADGWTRFQLWELMQIYGPMMIIGSSLMFETEIQIHGVNPDPTPETPRSNNDQ